MAATSSSRVFHDAIEKVFGCWPALQMAVEQGFGGVYSKDKAVWMIDAVYHFFQENDNLEPHEVEYFIAEILNNEFDTVIEDGTLYQTSELLNHYFTLCAQGRENEVVADMNKMPSTTVTRECLAKSSLAEAQNEDESSESEEEQRKSQMHDQHPYKENADEPMEHDAEDEGASGWTLVTHKKRK